MLFLPCLCLNGRGVAIASGSKALSGTNLFICRMWSCVPLLLLSNRLTKSPCEPGSSLCSAFFTRSRKHGTNWLFLLHVPSSTFLTCSSAPVRVACRSLFDWQQSLRVGFSPAPRLVNTP